MVLILVKLRFLLFSLSHARACVASVASPCVDGVCWFGRFVRGLLTISSGHSRPRNRGSTDLIEVSEQDVALEVDPTPLLFVKAKHPASVG
jgi:hypothetical protein